MSKADVALAVLTEGDRHALWLDTCQRETLRLLRYAHDVFTEDQIRVLVDAILEGPPRSLYREMPDEDWYRTQSRHIMHRLYKLQDAGVTLPDNAVTALARLNEQYPDIGFREGEGNVDEFPFYMWSGWVDEADGTGENLIASMPDEEFETWATDERDRGWDDYRGEWAGYCQNNPQQAYEKLMRLTEHNVWPASPWSSALYYFRQKMTAAEVDEQNDDLSDELFANIIQALNAMPEETMRDHANLADEVAHFIDFIARDSEPNEIYWCIWDKVWRASLNIEIASRDVRTEVLNQASGQLSEQILLILSRRKPEKDSGIPPDLEERFLRIVTADGNGPLIARVMLISRMPFMFFVDPDWSERHLAPLLSRAHVPNEWEQMWLGFIWSPRISPNLFTVIKREFLDVLGHLDEFEENEARRIVEVLGYLLVPADTYMTKTEAKKVLTALEPRWLSVVVHSLMSQLKNAGENDAPKMWREQMAPWFNAAWPRTRQAKEGKVSAALAEMAIYCFDATPDYVDDIEPFIGASDTDRINGYIYKLRDTRRHETYPEATLKLLSLVVNEPPQYTNRYLKEILADIINIKSDLSNSHEYRCLRQTVGY